MDWLGEGRLVTRSALRHASDIPVPWPAVMDSLTEAVDPLLLRAQARVGRTLREKWRLDALLGIGGMAAVYAGTHRNGKRGAIKVLHPELSVDANVRSRFLREGYVANKVGHPGAVAVLDDDTAEDGSVFLVMELLDGESVDARATRAGGRLPPEEVLSIADQVLDILAAAHANGIVHRDLKPENLFVTVDGQVKVLDFGIARLRESSSATTATRSGVAMGTPAFMAPEQARGLVGEIDARTDLWAVGATMFALLSGKLVHDGRTPNEVLVSAITKPAPSVASVRLDVPYAVAAVVDRALSYEKAERWPDARAMQHAVRVAYDEMHGSPISSAPKLTVPELAVARTLASAGVEVGSPMVAKTGEPVSAGRTGLARLRTQWSSRPGVAVGAGVGVLAFGVFVIAMVRHAGSATDESRAAGVAAGISAAAPVESASAAPTSSASATPPVVPAPSESAVSIDDLPVAKAATTEKSTSPSPATKPTSKPPRSAPTSAPAPTATTDFRDKRR